MAGLADPTDNDMCKLVKEAAHRSLGHAARKKDPVTPKMLQSLVSHFSADRLNLLTLRLLVMCVLAYAGFLRFDELLRIRACDIQSANRISAYSSKKPKMTFIETVNGF